MKRVLVLACLLGASLASAQVTRVPGVTVQDEGGTKATAINLNCTGSGISCSVSAGTATISASGGSGSANVVEVSVDLGTTTNYTVKQVTVTGQSWVTSSSVIVCAPFAQTNDSQTVENYIAADLHAVAASRVVGTGFDVWVRNNYGATGIFKIHCTGA